MRIAVLGVGAVGGLYGARMQRAGHELHYLMRSDVAEARAHGLRVDSPDGDFHLAQVHAYGDAREMPRCEVVLVAWKSTSNAALADTLPHVVADDGAVVMLQNGLAVEDEALAIVPEARMYGGLCFVCSHKAGPAHIHHLDFGYVTLGPHDARAHARQDEIASLFTDAGFGCEQVADVAAARWLKLGWNIPFSGLCTVLDCDTRVVMDDHRERATAILHEVEAIAAAEGNPWPAGHLERMLGNTDAMVPYLPSLTVDYRAGREMEIEPIFSRPLARAHAHALPVPELERMHAELLALSA